MGVKDGFLLWWGKALAEITIGLLVLATLLLGFALMCLFIHMRTRAQARIRPVKGQVWYQKDPVWGETYLYVTGESFNKITIRAERMNSTIEWNETLSEWRDRVLRFDLRLQRNVHG